jgi:hypothetical protein
MGDKMLRRLAVANMFEGCVVVLLQVKFHLKIYLSKMFIHLNFNCLTVGSADNPSRLGRFHLHRFLGWSPDGYDRHVDTAEKTQANDHHSSSVHAGWIVHGGFLFVASVHR